MKRYILFVLFFLLYNQKSYSQVLVDKIICTKSKTANIRNGPNTKFQSIYKINVNHYPMIKIKTIDNWSLIEDYNGKTGWISGILLTTSKCKNIITQDINMFYMPNENSLVLRKIDKGKLVNILFIDKKLGWARISIGKKTGWIKMQNLWYL
jgi:SH3-like domain-containing protein